VNGMAGTKRAAGYMRNKRYMDNLAGYAFLAPAMAGYILFIFGPIVLSAVLSFFNYSLIQTPKFVGLGNIQRMLKDALVGNSFGNTFKFLAILVPIHCVLGLILAFMVSRTRRLQSAYTPQSTSPPS
jgi:multiple sugar transport system permease protein